MKIRAQMRAHELLKCARTFYRDCARLCLVRAHLCTDLHKIWNLSLHHSNWPPYKISWRSELSLRRYLQNNTGVCLILIFNAFCIYSWFEHQNSLKIERLSKSFWWFFNANIKMETYQQKIPYNKSFNRFLDIE